MATAALWAGASAAHAGQLSCSWDGDDNWTAVRSWSHCNNRYPNNSGGTTYDVLISSGALRLANAVSVRNLSVNRGASWVLLTDGSTLPVATITGTLTSSGEILLSNRATIRTGGNLTNTGDGGSFDVGVDGTGSTVDIGGVLSNRGTLGIGRSPSAAPAAVTAKGLVNAGTIALDGSDTTAGSLTILGAARNSGLISIRGFSKLAVIGAGGVYAQTGGTTDLVGRLGAPSVQLSGGDLAGTGTITGNLVNAATVAPLDTSKWQPEGLSTLTLDGNYTQTAVGTLSIELAGGTTYGQLRITGTANLAGGLKVWMPQLQKTALSVGDSFTIMRFRSAKGDFNSFTFYAGDLQKQRQCPSSGPHTWHCAQADFEEVFQADALILKVTAVAQTHQ
jgi:hypothetical protein